VLARLLMPEAFGLMAVVLTLLTALTLLSDIGTGTVIIQSERGAEPAFLNTAWTMQIIRGVVIWLLGLLIALGIGWGQSWGAFRTDTVYDSPVLPLLLAASIFSMVLQGFSSVNDKLAERNLQLKLVAVIDLTVQVFALIVMIVGAYLTRSVWSIVVGSLAGAALQCALTHLLLKGPPPRLKLERAAMREILGKGKWVLVSSLLGFVVSNGDRALLGGLIDSTTMGHYSIALGLVSVAPAALSSVLMSVIFPVFSEVYRHRPAELAHVYRKIQMRADLIVGLVAGLLFILSHALVAFLYDDRYLVAGQFVALLAVGTLGVRFLVVEQIYLAMGRPSLLVLALLPRAAILLVGIPLGHAIAGMNGVLAAIVLSGFGHWPMAIWFRAKHELGQLGNDVLLPVGVGLGLAVGWLTARVLGSTWF
jgi:O-antigen/teichoic acid export membrane protein